jgi:hypothetical protein
MSEISWRWARFGQVPRRGRRQAMDVPRPSSAVLTVHARERAAEMGVNCRTVRKAVLKPEVSYRQSDYGPGAYMALAGKIACAYALKGTVAHVQTVLPRTHERFDSRTLSA